MRVRNLGNIGDRAAAVLVAIVVMMTLVVVVVMMGLVVMVVVMVVVMTSAFSVSSVHLGQSEAQQHWSVEVRVVPTHGICERCRVRARNSNVDDVITCHVESVARRCRNKSVEGS
jgi:hypothetical protein